MTSRSRKLVAEFLGTALLLTTVVGSGIMGEKLAGGNTALALLANTLATGSGLVVLILLFGPVSGAHFNPAVTLTEAWRNRLSRHMAGGYVLAQSAGALFGVALAHVEFDLPLYSLSTHSRSGISQIVSEVVATFGLILTIRGVSMSRPAAIPFGVGAYIMAAYWFTASTSFANPAVTLARAFSNSFAGIHLPDVPGFLLGQVLGAVAATFTAHWLFEEKP